MLLVRNSSIWDFSFCLFPEILLPELLLSTTGALYEDSQKEITPLFIGNLWVMVKEQTGLRVELITL